MKNGAEYHPTQRSSFMFNKARSFLKSNLQISIPVLLLVVSIAAYGILIPFLGLYWDGWPYMFQNHVFGPAGFPTFVASDRPHSAFVFMILSSLFGTHLWAYHVFALICHWLAAYGVWLTLNEIWPNNKDFNALPALFFAIYPGFLQQPIAYPYSHHLSHLALFIFSLYFMLRAIREPDKYIPFTMLALVLSLNIYSLEYFATLELIRPILLFYCLRNAISPGFSTIIKKVIRLWAPYLAILIGFLVWRIFIFQFPTYEPTLVTELSSSANGNFLTLLSRIGRDFYTTNIFAWLRNFIPPRYEVVWAKGVIGYWGLLISMFIFLLFALLLFRHDEKGFQTQQRKSQTEWARDVIVLGLLCFFFSGWVVWITQLPLELEFAWDRLTLTFMLGACLELSGLILFLFRSKFFSSAVFALLIAAACAGNFVNALGFARDWESFKDFMWQLSWRVPVLEPGTTILTTRFPLKYYSDNSLTAPINWMFAPDNHTNRLDYLLSFIDVRIGWRIKALEPGHDIDQPYRSFYFKGTTSQVISLNYNPPGCLQIMDPIYANAGILLNLNDYQADASKMTDLALITQSEKGSLPPTEVIGSEPEHDWCYFFEKVDLARQFGNWDEIVNLGNQAFEQGKVARVPTEWLPFFEAYLRSNQTKEVERIISMMMQDEPERYKKSICFTLNRISQDPSVNPDFVSQYLQKYSCE